MFSFVMEMNRGEKRCHAHARLLQHGEQYLALVSREGCHHMRVPCGACSLAPAELVEGVELAAKVLHGFVYGHRTVGLDEPNDAPLVGIHCPVEDAAQGPVEEEGRACRPGDLDVAQPNHLRTAERPVTLQGNTCTVQSVLAQCTRWKSDVVYA